MKDIKEKKKKHRNPDSIKKENLRKLEEYLKFSKKKTEVNGDK